MTLLFLIIAFMIYKYILAPFIEGSFEKQKIKIATMKFFTIIALLVLVGISMAIYDNKISKESKILTSTEYFIENKKQVLDTMNFYFTKLKFTELDAIIERYKDVDDADLEEFKKQVSIRKNETKNIRAKKILNKLKKIPASKFNENYVEYKKLVDIYPKNNTYIAKMKHYEKKKIDAEAKEAAEQIFYGKRPTQSSWDGSYYEVKNYLKSAMHNPDSLDFKGCTKVYKQKEGWLVGCQFRGTNGFGAMILNSKWFTIRQQKVINIQNSNAYKW